MKFDRDSWETPKNLWNEINEQYDFIIDCCATKHNSKAPKFCVDFLESYLNFLGEKAIVWMNPPFSKAYEMFEHFFKIVKKGVAIYRCDNMETKLWQEQILKNASWIFIFNKRIQYDGQVGGGARFPSALIGFNVPPPKLKNGYLIRC